MSKHTPGPWIINDQGGNAVLIEAEDYDVAIVNNAGPENGSVDVRNEAMANAALIASAPDLLKERDEARTSAKRIEREAEKKISELCEVISKHKNTNRELLEALKHVLIAHTPGQGLTYADIEAVTEVIQRAEGK